MSTAQETSQLLVNAETGKVVSGTDFVLGSEVRLLVLFWADVSFKGYCCSHVLVLTRRGAVVR